MSVMAINNSTAFGHVLEREKNRFNLLFKRKAMLHHYTEYIEVDQIKEAESCISQVIADYSGIEKQDDSLLPSRRLYNDLTTVQLFPAF